MPKFTIKDKIEITWEEVRMIKEIAETDFQTRDITKIMSMILRRNLKIIINLYRYFLLNNDPRDIADFVTDDI